MQAYDHKSFDFWSLKKSILNTLLQAVKAIKGGVLAVNGQLIKGGGHLISAKGKLISSKGEALTTLGKNIASAALLSPHHDGHSASGHDGKLLTRLHHMNNGILHVLLHFITYYYLSVLTDRSGYKPHNIYAGGGLFSVHLSYMLYYKRNLNSTSIPALIMTIIKSCRKKIFWAFNHEFA